MTSDEKILEEVISVETVGVSWVARSIVIIERVVMVLVIIGNVAFETVALRFTVESIEVSMELVICVVSITEVTKVICDELGS